jgi:hypothetical protein
MIKEIQKNPKTGFKITVRDEPVAEIRLTKAVVQPGETVRKLIHLRQKLSYSLNSKTRKPISRKVKDYLY